jgi:hypothetical protein
VSYSRVSVAEPRVQLANQEEEKCPPLEVVTRELMKTLTRHSSLFGTMMCKVQSRTVLK